MKQYTFVLNFGYVESSGVSYTPFTSRDQFPNAKKALISLAEFLKERFMANRNDDIEPKQCCLKTRSKDEDAIYCSTCKRSLKDFEFDGEEFTQWLSDMDGVDLDIFHSSFIDYDEEAAWQSQDLENAPNPRFVYQAEWVIAAAVGYNHREGHDFKTICTNRTKEKKISFSYF